MAEADERALSKRTDQFSTNVFTGHSEFRSQTVMSAVSFNNQTGQVKTAKQLMEFSPSNASDQLKIKTFMEEKDVAFDQFAKEAFAAHNEFRNKHGLLPILSDQHGFPVNQSTKPSSGGSSGSSSAQSAPKPDPPATKPATPKPNPLLSQPDIMEFDQFKRDCLLAHNEYRKKHGSPPLKLTKWLCKQAQDWAENCAARCVMYHSTGDPNHKNDNENICGSYDPPSKIKGRESADRFYKEIQYYQFGRGGFSTQTGHFTAMVWKSCKELGVGMATDRNGLTYVVNSYSPPAHYGDFATNVLPAQY